jgi:hypothetical protein
MLFPMCVIAWRFVLVKCENKIPVRACETPALRSGQKE